MVDSSVKIESELEAEVAELLGLMYDSDFDRLVMSVGIRRGSERGFFVAAPVSVGRGLLAELESALGVYLKAKREGLDELERRFGRVCEDGAGGVEAAIGESADGEQASEDKGSDTAVGDAD